MDSIFAIRLKAARKMRDLSMDDLCRRMGNVVSKQSISKYENAKMMPDSTVLIKIADALNLDVDYFFRPIKFTVDSSSIMFRKKAKLGRKKEESIKEEIADKLERYFEIEEILSIRASCFSALPDEISDDGDARGAALALRKKWSLGMEAVSNLISSIESKGIKVVFVEEEKTFDGLSGFVNGQYPFIAVNKSTTSERLRFSVSHELGHLVLSVNGDDKKKEHLCHVFASEFLLPSSTLLSKVGRVRDKISVHELILMQREYGISVAAIMYKARELGVITDSAYRNFCIHRNKNEAFRNFCDFQRFSEPDASLFRLYVLRALSEELITNSKACNLLGESSVDEIVQEPF